MRALREVQDETPPSIGDEIGHALSGVVAEISQSNADMAEKLAGMLSKAMSDALKAVDSKQINIEKSTVQEWVFSVERDKQGLMTQITAKAVQ
jgi:hypothetical protein